MNVTTCGSTRCTRSTTSSVPVRWLQLAVITWATSIAVTATVAQNPAAWVLTSQVLTSHVPTSQVHTSLVLPAAGQAERASAAGDQLPAEPATDPSWSFGYELFQMLLEERGLQLSDMVDDALQAPPESVIVMMGDLSSISQPEWLRLQRFAANGGTVLMASDQPLSRAGIRGGPISTEIRSQQYQGFADCIIVDQLSDRSPLTRGIRQLVLNRAGWLTVPWSGTLNWFVAARLPPDCRPSQSSEQPVLLVGWPRRQGRLPEQDDRSSRGTMILSSDPSLFTNLMLWHGDNAILAIRISELLCNGQRSRLVFLVDQQPRPGVLPSVDQQSTPASTPPSPPPALPPDLPIPPVDDLPEPELSTMLRLANSVIREVEESNLFNEALMNQPRRVRQPVYQRMVMLVLAGIAGLYLLWRLAQKNSVQSGAITPRAMQTSLQMQATDAGRSLQTASSQYGAAAEVLARDLCHQLTGSVEREEWQRSLAGGTLPGGGRALTKSLRSELQFALELAVRGCSVHISRRRFETFGRSLRQLREVTTSKSS